MRGRSRLSSQVEPVHVADLGFTEYLDARRHQAVHVPDQR